MDTFPYKNTCCEDCVFPTSRAFVILLFWTSSTCRAVGLVGNCVISCLEDSKPSVANYSSNNNIGLSKSHQQFSSLTIKILCHRISKDMSKCIVIVLQELYVRHYQYCNFSATQILLPIMSQAHNFHCHYF